MKALPWVAPTVTELGAPLTGWEVLCTSCGHSPVTLCTDYLRRDQGLPPHRFTRWVCGCGATGVVS